MQDGTIIPLSEARRPQSSGSSSIFGVHGDTVRQGTYSRRGGNGIVRNGGLNPQDPLGLLQLNEEMKVRALYALQLVGSFGVIGGLAFWITSKWHNMGADFDTQAGMDWMGRMGLW